MIQRIQTVYLLLSVVAVAVCLALPLGHYTTEAHQMVATLTNLCIKAAADGSRAFTPWALGALLIIEGMLSLTAIFLFRRRALQMRVCSLCILLLVGYYVVLAVAALRLGTDGGSFRPTLTAGLPLVAMVLDYMAFRAILRDEMLVRSLDRIR